MALVESIDPIEGDVCIVGAGPTGIAAALELADSGFNVVVLEAGGDSPKNGGPDYFQGACSDYEEHPSVARFRDSCFGGTSWSWPGRCIPFDEIDFTPRRHVAHSGWPFGIEALNTYYERAQSFCHVGRYNYHAADVVPHQPADLFAETENSPFATDTLERWSNNWNFGTIYRRQVEYHPRITLLTHTACQAIQTTPDGAKVTSIEAMHRGSIRRRIRAKFYILAAGGLENARLLLSGNDACTRGIGNQYDLVGRYYTKHFHGVYASVVFTDPVFAEQMFRYAVDVDGTFVRRRLSLTPAAQREHGLLNFSAFLRQPVAADPTHGNAMLSMVHYLQNLGVRKNGQPNGKSHSAPQSPLMDTSSYSHFGNIMQDVWNIPRYFLDQRKRHKDARRGLPGPDFLNKNNIYRIHYYSEQEPVASNRVYLSDSYDSLGLRRLHVDYSPTELDRTTVARSHQLLDELLRRGKKGYLLYETETRDYNAPPHFECVGGHFMGTTRMGRSEKDGVVDSYGRVFGVPNLFVAGSSVFPTSSHANPTLTLIALALRMTDHISEEARLAA